MTEFTKSLDKAKERESKMKEMQKKNKDITDEGGWGSHTEKVKLGREEERKAEQ